MKTGNISSIIASGASATVAVVCPGCWPALGSLLGSLGLSASASTAILQPLLVIFLVVAAVGFVRGYRAHSVPWPMVAGLVGGSLLYIGKWVVFNFPLFYVGVALLITASIADTVLRRRTRSCSTNGQCNTALPKNTKQDAERSIA